MTFKPLSPDHPLLVAGAAVLTHVNEYINGYAMEADEGTYHPNEQEQMLIRDAIYGLIDEDDFQRRINETARIQAETQLNVALKVMTNMIEPVMIVILAMGVGGLLFSVLSAMFAITSNIAR